MTNAVLESSTIGIVSVASKKHGPTDSDESHLFPSENEYSAGEDITDSIADSYVSAGTSRRHRTESRTSALNGIKDAYSKTFPRFVNDVNSKDWTNVVLTFIGWLCYIAAAGMASYLVFSIIQNESIQKSIATGVIKDTETWPGARVKSDYDKAVEYNKTLGNMSQRIVGDVVDKNGKPIEDSDQAYMDTLNLNHSGAMAVLSIPKISAEMTIWHTTGASVLEKGVGHVYGTAMPIGQKGTMSAIAAHSGGVNGLFFTRLHQLSVGDYFYINVLGKQMGYQIDWIKVVNPEDVGETILHTKPNEARVTMITCTPIGVNTQRLIVSGIRKSMPQPIPEAYTQKDTTLEAARTAIMVFTLLLVVAIVFRTVLKSRKPNAYRNGSIVMKSNATGRNGNTNNLSANADTVSTVSDVGHGSSHYLSEKRRKHKGRYRHSKKYVKSLIGSDEGNATKPDHAFSTESDKYALQEYEKTKHSKDTEMSMTRMTGPDEGQSYGCIQMDTTGIVAPAVLNTFTKEEL